MVVLPAGEFLMGSPDSDEEAYEEEKRKRLLLDFNDLLMEAHSLLKCHEDRCHCYHRAYPHILVDEFQDTNFAQMKILNLLAGKNDHSSFWVCGDDCQSIFGFTGASVTRTPVAW